MHPPLIVENTINKFFLMNQAKKYAFQKFLGEEGGKGDLEKSRFNWVFLNDGVPYSEFSSDEKKCHMKYHFDRELSLNCIQQMGLDQRINLNKLVLSCAKLRLLWLCSSFKQIDVVLMLLRLVSICQNIEVII
jgi:hypothetical protein